jgi:hypothetical protein
LKLVRMRRSQIIQRMSSHMHDMLFAFYTCIKRLSWDDV